MKRINTVSNGPSVHCNVFDYCSANQSDKGHCWEVARSNCDFHYVFNICTDCIVYLYNKNGMEMSRKDIDGILQQRKPLLDN